MDRFVYRIDLHLLLRVQTRSPFIGTCTEEASFYKFVNRKGLHLKIRVKNRPSCIGTCT